MKRRDPQELLETMRRLCPPGEDTAAPITIISRDDTGFLARMELTPDTARRIEEKLREPRGGRKAQAALDRAVCPSARTEEAMR